MRLNIAIPGSLQNPTFSPDGTKLLITVWHGGYNEGLADLYTVDLNNFSAHCITTALKGQTNVSQPGCLTCFTEEGIIFSSTRLGTDWPHWIDHIGTNLVSVDGYTSGTHSGYEPTATSRGVVAFERHKAGDEGNGQIVFNGKVISTGDSRQPCLNPQGTKIVYQRHAGTINLFVYDIDTKQTAQVTHGKEFTDATWNPEGTDILCSSVGGLWNVPLEGTLKLIFPTAGYLGAPSWSPNGKHIVAEAYSSDPDGSRGTWIELL